MHRLIVISVALGGLLLLGSNLPLYAEKRGREIAGKDGAPMVLVPAGEFLYGEDNDRESLPAFYMDKYEVTTALYDKFLLMTNRQQPDYWEQVSVSSVGDRPVVGVDWHDAEAYCFYYDKRLPTEREWEKAARGTDGRKYPWGNDGPSDRYANYGKKYSGNFYHDRLTPVGTYEAGKSPYGIYDLAGNVWEWTDSDEGSSKVIRGGSWYSDALYLQSTYRNRESPKIRFNYIIGFRCLQDTPK